MTICFCTLAINAPYRQRARLLCADVPTVPWILLTDNPGDFADLPVQAIRHMPTGPMAAEHLAHPEYLAHLPPPGEHQGSAAYHDKRFAILAALQEHETAIYVDADSRISEIPRLGVFPSGLAVLPILEESVAEHLATCGSWRLPAFVDLARHLTGDAGILQSARWCYEALIAVTQDGRESRFFTAWSIAADFLQARGVYSGEGGVIGLAAAYAGWSVDYDALTDLADSIRHEAGGPKNA